MSRRFQFSLRALILTMAMATLPLGPYCYLRSQPAEITAYTNSDPVIIRAWLPRKPSDSVVEFVLARRADPASADYEPFSHGFVETKRSWFGFCVAEIKILRHPGRYAVLAMWRGPGHQMRYEFTVDEIE